MREADNESLREPVRPPTPARPGTPGHDVRDAGRESPREEASAPSTAARPGALGRDVRDPDSRPPRQAGPAAPAPPPPSRTGAVPGDDARTTGGRSPTPHEAAPPPLPPLDVMASGQGLRAMSATAAAAERAGFDGLWLTEGGRTSFGAATAAALATSSLTIGTGIAVAFARSPMVTAVAARELQEATGGRFVLGLGTQVRAHVERRYSAEFDRPGPRLREYAEAVRAIWRAFRGDERLRHKGEFYRFTLLTPEWSPGPTALPDPEIHLAGVNPWMLRMIGEVGDGLHVHPLHSPRYLDEVVRPELAAGAARAGRDAADVTVVVPVMTATGDTDEEIARARDELRTRVAFYGSTPGYARVFEAHGWDDLQPRLHRLFAARDPAALSAAITDEVLDAVTVSAPWDALAGALAHRYRGRADRLICYSALSGGPTPPERVERWAGVVADWRKAA